MEISASASDILDLVDGVLSNIKAETLEDTLNFVEGVSSNFQILSVSDYFRLNDYATVTGEIILNIADTLTFDDSTLPRVLVAEASDFLFMYDVVDQPLGDVIRDSFVLTDEALYTLSYIVGPDTVEFSDSMTLVFNPSKTIEESISLSDLVSCVRINDDSVVLSGSVPSASETVAFTDSYETVTLHCPDFGDSESITYVRLNKTTRGYTPVIVGVATWLPRRARKMMFSYLKEEEVARLRIFWRRNAGLPVTLTDIYGDSRTVILQNPEYETAQVGRENRSITLDLYVL